MWRNIFKYALVLFLWMSVAANAQVLKQWPYSGQWRVSLYQLSNSKLMCQAEATGHDPKAYSLSFMRLPKRLFLIYSEADPLVKHGANISLTVDGRAVASFVPTVNNNGLSTELPAGDGTEKFFNTLSNGSSLMIDTGVAQHQISLTGFPVTLQNLVECSRQLKG